MGVKGTWWEKADLTVSDVLMPRSLSIATVVANQLVSIKGKCRTRVNIGTQPRLASVAPLVAHPFLDDHFFHGEVPFIAVLPVARGNYQRRQVTLLLDHHHHHLPSLGRKEVLLLFKLLYNWKWRFFLKSAIKFNLIIGWECLLL